MVRGSWDLMARRRMPVISGRSWRSRPSSTARQFTWSYSPRSASDLRVCENPAAKVFAAAAGMGRSSFPPTPRTRPAARTAGAAQEPGSRVSSSTCSWTGSPCWARWTSSRQSAPWRFMKVAEEVSRASVSMPASFFRRSMGIRSRVRPLATARAEVAAFRTGSCSPARASMRANATTTSRGSRLRNADARIARQAAPRSSASLEFRQGSATVMASPRARQAASLS